MELRKEGSMELLVFLPCLLFTYYGLVPFQFLQPLIPVLKRWSWCVDGTAEEELMFPISKFSTGAVRITDADDPT